MGNISLYYIDGISRSNTPVFADQVSQRFFFASHGYYIIDDNSFYVPHFNDMITLSTEDIRFSSQYNYLSIKFNDKFYYYFIDSIKYISETVIELSISMDVIQTYMFNMSILNGELARNTIKRWVKESEQSQTYLINRNYIRENHAKSDFVFRDVKYYNNQNDFSLTKSAGSSTFSGMVVIKTTTEATATEEKGTNFEYTFDNWNLHITDAFTYYFIPVSQGKISNNQRWSSPTQANLQVEARNSLIRKIKTDATIKDVYYLPFNPLTGVEVYQEIVNFSGVTDLEMVDVQQIANQYLIGIVEGRTPYVKTHKDLYTFDFERNTNRLVAFDIKYIPALLDENYLRLEFGESSVSAVFPLYELTKPELTLNYIGIINDGTRVYYCTGDSNVNVIEEPVYGSSFKDLFKTAAVASSASRIDILTDPYSEYMTYTKGALIGALVQTAGGAFSSFASGAMTNAAIGKHTYGSYALSAGDADMQSRQLMIGDYRRSINDINTGRNIAGSASPLVSWAQGGLNATFMPDKVRQVGSANTDRVTNAITVRTTTYNVQDIEEVGKFYETYGYKVTDIVHSVSLSSFSNRVYYDYILINNATIKLTGVLQDNLTVSLIADRLSEGLRLWHTYDDELICETDGFYMGQVCLYDNAEVQ